MVRYSRTLLAILADNGIISYGRFKQLLKVYPNYVPLHREFDENADIVRRQCVFGIAQSDDAIQRRNRLDARTKHERDL